MSDVLPTLDTLGWVSDVSHKADRALSYFMVSEYSQTRVHRGKVKSFPWFLNEYGHDLIELRLKLIDAFKSLFSAYFDQAQVEVEIKEIVTEDGRPTGKVDIRLMAIVTDANKQYSIGRLCNTENGKLVKLIDLKQAF